MGLRISGLEHLPPSGPFLLSPNHQSYLDGFVLVGALPYALFRRLFFVGASEYFETPVDAEARRAAGASCRSIRTPTCQGDAGGRVRPPARTVCSRCSPKGSDRRTARRAASRRARRSRRCSWACPIVPVAIHGVFEVWPRGKGLQWDAARCPGRARGRRCGSARRFRPRRRPRSPPPPVTSGTPPSCVTWSRRCGSSSTQTRCVQVGARRCTPCK